MHRALAVAILLAAASPAVRAADGDSYEGKTSAEWRTVLAGKDEKQKVRAASALARIGPPAADALPDLAKALTGSPKNADLRTMAALALGKIAGKDDMLGGLNLPRRLPGDLPGGGRPPSPPEKTGPGGGSGAGAGPADEKRAALLKEKILPALLAGLRDSVGDVRVNTARALGLLGADAAPAGTALVKAMGDTVEGARKNAAEALGRIPDPPAEAVTALAKALADADAGMADIAACSLAKYGARALPALKDLAAALDRDVAKPRSPLPFGLGARNLPNIPGAGGMGEPVTLSVNLCLALAGLGKDAAPAVPSLVRALKAKGVPARNAAVQALSAIRSVPEVSVPALAAALDDPAEEVCGLACIALADFGPDARSALPALEKFRDRKQGNLAKNAQYAIDRIGGKAVATGEGEVAPATPGSMSTHGGSHGGTMEIWK